jgi:hypothetical protein
MARKFLTELAVDASLILPGAAPSTPAAGHIYRVGNSLLYRDSAAGEQLLLNAADNLANLTNPATARNNLGLNAFADGIIFTISNRGEVATPSTNYDESLPLDFPATVTRIRFITHIDNTGSGATTLNAYKRTPAGTKTSLLSANATLAAGVSVVTGSLAGTAGVLSLAAGDRLGVDLIGLGTGASGIKCVIEFNRPAL